MALELLELSRECATGSIILDDWQAVEATTTTTEVEYQFPGAVAGDLAAASMRGSYPHLATFARVDNNDKIIISFVTTEGSYTLGEDTIDMYVWTEETE